MKKEGRILLSGRSHRRPRTTPPRQITSSIQSGTSKSQCRRAENPQVRPAVISCSATYFAFSHLAFRHWIGWRHDARQDMARQDISAPASRNCVQLARYVWLWGRNGIAFSRIGSICRSGLA